MTAEATIHANVPRFTQGVLAVLIGLGLVTGWLGPLVVAFACVAVPTVGGPAPLAAAYSRLVAPRIDVREEYEAEEPHRFTEALAAAVLGAALLASAAGATTLGWGLAAVVAGHAAMALAGHSPAGALHARLAGR